MSAKATTSPSGVAASSSSNARRSASESGGSGRTSRRQRFQRDGTRRTLVAELSPPLEPLDGQVGEPLEQLAVRYAGCVEQPRVDARRGEPGNRVQLVDEHLAVVAHEAVGARHPLAVR